MYMKTEYLPTVVMQAVLARWNEVREERYTCTSIVEVSVHENRVLTRCGCAGSDGQGVMEDVKRYMYTCTVKVNT